MHLYTFSQEIEKPEIQVKVKKLAEVIFPAGSSMKKVVDCLAPLKFPQAKELLTSDDMATGKVMYIQVVITRS